LSVAAFLAELRNRDMEVWADGDQLRLNAPAGALTPELRDHLQRRKSDILAFLRTAGDLGAQQRAIVPLQPHGTRDPVFAIAGHNGDVFTYRALVQRLGDAQPFFGLEPPGLDGRSEPLTSVEDLAGYFADQITAFRSSGPSVIAGYCAGGTIAFELARQLVARGATVKCVALFAGPWPFWYRPAPATGRPRPQSGKARAPPWPCARVAPSHRSSSLSPGLPQPPDGATGCPSSLGVGSGADTAHQAQGSDIGCCAPLHPARFRRTPERVRSEPQLAALWVSLGALGGAWRATSRSRVDPTIVTATTCSSSPTPQ